jgi:hypothetical protein
MLSRRLSQASLNVLAISCSWGIFIFFSEPRVKQIAGGGSAPASHVGATFWEVLMGLGDLFKKIFDPSAATPVDERALSGTSENALASSLEKLADGERGWIPLAQAALLFSTEDRQYAFGELDDAGKNRLAIFAADHRCTPDFRPTEGRMYFRK